MSKLPPQIWLGGSVATTAFIVVTFAPTWAAPWIIAGAIYVLFISHYQNWRGALTKQEIDLFMNSVSKNQIGSPPDLKALRVFLEEDQGKEFFMQNLVKLHDDDIKDPQSGQMARPRQVLGTYVRSVVGRLLARGGHPVMTLSRVGANVDAWGPTSEMGAQWPASSVMRYRSRRDFLKMVADDSFGDLHANKVAAIAETIAYPTHVLVAGHVGPRIYVALVLSLAASVANTFMLAAGYVSQFSSANI